MAFYLKDRLNLESTQKIILECSSKSWNQEYANVLLFLAHLSKDRFIVDTMLQVAKATFADIVPPSLQGELTFMVENGFDSISLDDEEESSKESRLQALEETSNESMLTHTPYALKRTADKNEVGLIGELSAALKTLQVLGQLLKNFPASFDPSRKVEIVDECIQLGLRTLGRYFSFAEQGKFEILKEFAELVKIKMPGINDSDAKEKAAVAISNLCHIATFGVVKRTSLAIGSNDLANTYLKVFGKALNPAQELIKISLDLDHAGHFPEETIIKSAKKWNANPFAKRVLRTLVVRHFRLFHLSFAVRQRIGEKLEISYKQTTALPVRDKLIPD